MMKLIINCRNLFANGPKNYVPTSQKTAIRGNNHCSFSERRETQRYIVCASNTQVLNGKVGSKGLIPLANIPLP